MFLSVSNALQIYCKQEHICIQFNFYNVTTLALLIHNLHVHLFVSSQSIYLNISKKWFPSNCSTLFWFLVIFAVLPYDICCANSWLLFLRSFMSGSDTPPVEPHVRFGDLFKTEGAIMYDTVISARVVRGEWFQCCQ